MNLQELKDKISLITNETKPGANTAQRIGSTMLDIVNCSVYGKDVVDITEGFDDLILEPGAYYDIHNKPEDDVFISFNDSEFYPRDQYKHILFTFNEMTSNVLLRLLAGYGAKLKPDTSKEGYKYYDTYDTVKLSKGSFDYGIVTVYFSNDIISNDTVDILISINDEHTNITLTNVNVINSSYSDIVYLDSVVYDSDETYYNIPICLLETTNDNMDFAYKYNIISSLTEYMGMTYCYSLTEYLNADFLYLDELSYGITVKPNNDVISDKKYNTYTFNIKSPCKLQFYLTAVWENNDVPNFTKNTEYIINVQNGIFSYTEIEDSDKVNNLYFDINKFSLSEDIEVNESNFGFEIIIPYETLSRITNTPIDKIWEFMLSNRDLVILPYNKNINVDNEMAALFNIDEKKLIVLSSLPNNLSNKVGYVHFKDNGFIGSIILTYAVFGGLELDLIPYIIDLVSSMKGLCVSNTNSGEFGITIFFPNIGSDTTQYYISKNLTLSEFNLLRLVSGDYDFAPIKPTIYHISNLLSEAIYLEPDYSNYVNKVIVVGNFTINESYPEQIFVFSGYNTNTNNRQVSITDPGDYQFRYELGKLTINKTY